MASVLIGLQMVLFHIMQTWRSLLWKDLQLNYWHILLISRPKKIAWITLILKNIIGLMLYLRINRMKNRHIADITKLSQFLLLSKSLYKSFPFSKSLVKIIYNPIDHEDIIKKEKQYEPLPSKSKIRLISIGRLTKVKTHVVCSTSLYVWSNPDTLSNYGYWEMVKTLIFNIISAKQLEDCYSMGIPNKSIPPWMTQSDLFVCSSISEGYSTA